MWARRSPVLHMAVGQLASCAAATAPSLVVQTPSVADLTPAACCPMQTLGRLG